MYQYFETRGEEESVHGSSAPEATLESADDLDRNSMLPGPTFTVQSPDDLTVSVPKIGLFLARSPREFASLARVGRFSNPLRCGVSELRKACLGCVRCLAILAAVGQVLLFLKEA